MHCWVLLSFESLSASICSLNTLFISYLKNAFSPPTPPEKYIKQDTLKHCSLPGSRKTKKNLQNSKKQKPFAGLQIKPRKLLNLNPKIKNEAAPISGRQQQDWSKCKEMEN